MSETEPFVMNELKKLVDERDWKQFHTPENFAKSISIEAAELLECFQWQGTADNTLVQEELADVLTYCFLLANSLGVSPSAIILEKLEKTKNKYPKEAARGRSTKYDKL
jgi:NTP pyrophosphatase (non-canonical NTP hydrolase)